MLENYKLLPLLLIRTPLLSVNILTSLESVDLRLKISYDNKTVQEAIFLASPDLYYLLIKWIYDKGDLSSSENQRMVEPLLKYLTRMCTRCTPFGIFAGYNLGEWDKSTSLTIDHTYDKRSVRFDMMLMSHLTNLLSKNEIIKHQLKYYPNSSLHEFAGNYRYFETISSSSDVKYHLSEIDKNPYIYKSLHLANKGIKIDDLCKMLIDTEIDYEDAKIFILDLIENQILVNELEPVITGEPYLFVLLKVLNRIRGELGELPEEVESAFNIINVANSFFQSISHNDSEINLANYEKIFNQIKKVIPEINQKYVFQVDLVTKFINNKVCSKHAGHIRQATEILNKIFQSPEYSKLNVFKQEFYKRYEHEEVPLLQVLDNESGIGYPVSVEEADLMPVIDDIVTNYTVNSDISKEVTINKWIQKKYLAAIAEGQIEVSINDNDLNDLKEYKEVNKYPDTISVLGSIVQSQYDCSEKILLKATFLSAPSLLGRFTHSDQEIDKYIKYITHYEQQLNKGKILAEIVHLPQSRTGNIIIRSHLRDYEIPFLVKSTLPEDNIIKISDLTISISKNLDRIILKSKKLNKEILPRLSTAHNFNWDNQLPLYRFLCDLQYQDQKIPITFDWNQTGVFYPLKPRVIYKNVILHRASWVFESKELESLKLHILKGNITEVRKWRELWKIPSTVVLVEGDNELFLDLENSVFLSLFVKSISNSNQIELLEFLFQPTNCVVKDKEERMYANEFIMTFAKEIDNHKTEFSIPKIKSKRKNDKIDRLFSIGGEWIYLKVYLGFRTADEILFTFCKLINKYKKKGIIHRWFFIRYNDPKFHIRIRICLKDKNNVGIILSEVYKAFNSKIKNGKIFNIQMDTYRREIERYGDDVIYLVEKYFELQSTIIIDFLKITIHDSEQDLLKFIFAIKFVDLFLADFGFNLENKKIFVDNSLLPFEKEFQTNGITKQLITKKYRSLEPLINSVFENTSIELKNWDLINSLINNYSNFHRTLINEIKRGSSLFKNNGTRDSFIWSLNHMFINKLARANTRKFEYIVYAILDKYLNKLYHKTILN